MSQHARIEEISDSDSDPAEMDPSDFDPANIMERISSPNAPESPYSGPMLQSQLRPPVQRTTDREKSKHWQCLYPVYFDSNRTRAEGRRVGQDLAVPNPLAREIVDAAASLGLNVVFEPDKTHPKDWSNPGRVRVLLKENGRHIARNIKNKHHLYTLISKDLKTHPTTTSTPLRLRIAGLPPPKEPLPKPAVPRGWKMNAILPLHSPALTGGGVSENFLQEMMAEMQGEVPGIGSASGGEGGKKKKEKKKQKS
ncbi:signal recognition particle, SRP19 subunit [Lepidopterella palustris CBS 459.81]|uniref:Signal recognition particle, SRP19 subunit n=1 Tax=Lepidopterella palustris CBS 459.81 TaxID=1314670 RepID=A0A8E2ED54_9PEZI|nr:signal recognition particle, SRP19 subunit [Lepidopterella palustris CBS 459.81]